VSLSGAASRGDVLNQTITVSDGAGRGFLLRAWVLLRSAGAGAEVQLDLFDLGPKTILYASPSLTTAAEAWVPLEVSGQLPQRAAPQVQVRLLSKGTLSASLDDVSLTLR
jgi:hypothetical protein